MVLYKNRMMQFMKMKISINALERSKNQFSEGVSMKRVGMKSPSDTRHYISHNGNELWLFVRLSLPG